MVWIPGDDVRVRGIETMAGKPVLRNNRTSIELVVARVEGREAIAVAIKRTPVSNGRRVQPNQMKDSLATDFIGIHSCSRLL